LANGRGYGLGVPLGQQHDSSLSTLADLQIRAGLAPLTCLSVFAVVSLLNPFETRLRSSRTVGLRKVHGEQPGPVLPPGLDPTSDPLEKGCKPPTHTRRY
jgi:hypothetical protein